MALKWIVKGGVRFTAYPSKFLLLLLLLLSLKSHAARVEFFDIDGTVVHDSGLNEEGKEPAWWAYWVLTRMAHVNSGWTQDDYQKLDSAGKLPPQVLLTRWEIDLVRDKLAKREGRPGSFEEFSLRPDPVREARRNQYFSRRGSRPDQFVPGYYLIVPQITYMFHHDRFTSENNLLKTYRAAVERTKSDPARYEWRGPAFPYLDRALRRQDQHNRVSFVTDRDPEDREALVSWLEAMHQDGYLSNPVKRVEGGDVIRPRLISTTGTEGRYFGSIFEFDARKANALEEQISSISRSAMEKHLVLSPDLNQALAGQKFKMHEAIFYENKPEYINALIIKMKYLAVQYPNVKLILYIAGSKDQVQSSDFNTYRAKASRWIIFTPTAKGWREPLPEELAELENLEDSRVMSCANIFGGQP